MAMKTASYRRWLGAVFLAAALFMLFAGEFFLKRAFSPLGFLIYWLVCLALTVLAMLMALIEARVVRQRSITEQRALFDSTLANLRSRHEERGKRSPSPRSLGLNGS